MVEDEGAVIRFEAVPDSPLMKNFRMGRPRDTRFDGVVRRAFEDRQAHRAIVAEHEVEEVIRGIKRGAKHLGVSVSFTATRDSEDPTRYVVEFIAYETHRRNKGEEDSE